MASSTEYPDLTTFKALSFDVYGTLISWEPAMLASLHKTITSHLPTSHPYNTSPPTAALTRFDAITRDLESPTQQPVLRYDAILAKALTQLGAEVGVDVPEAVAADFARSPGKWEPFADTVAGLQKLHRYYGKLIALSNVDNANIGVTVGERLAPARFDAVYTAEDIGSYKPSRDNFEFLFRHAKEDLGVDWEEGDLLHVARSLPADHVPAKELGFRSVWISRGGNQEGKYGVGGDYTQLKDKTAFEWRFDTLGDFADEVERQFVTKEGKS